MPGASLRGRPKVEPPAPGIGTTAPSAYHVAAAVVISAISRRSLLNLEKVS
jgi:hypothetical protein